MKWFLATEELPEPFEKVLLFSNKYLGIGHLIFFTDRFGNKIKSWRDNANEPIDENINYWASLRENDLKLPSLITIYKNNIAKYQKMINDLEVLKEQDV